MWKFPPVKSLLVYAAGQEYSTSLHDEAAFAALNT